MRVGNIWPTISPGCTSSRASGSASIAPNYLGRLVQRNTWTDDGHAFFAEQRVLRYLDEPRSTEALTATDRSRVEHLAARLPALVPDQPASLLHGDLWWANVIGPAEPGGRRG